MIKKSKVTFYCLELDDEFFMQGNSQTDYNWYLTIRFSRWCDPNDSYDDKTGTCPKYETEKEELDKKLKNFQLLTMQNS